jgi:predicted phage terminase large subunit-like protein
MMTRWSERDLAGHLLTQAETPGTPPWTIVELPAFREERHQKPYYPESCTLLPLDWRQPEDGQALVPERYPAPVLQGLRSTMTAYEWSALYSQRPTPPEGSLFKRNWFHQVDAAPELRAVVRYWDFGATEGGGDPTSGCRAGWGTDGWLYITDVVRGQWGPGEALRTFVATVEADGKRQRQVIEQEPGSAGKSAVHYLSRQVPGYSVRGDKVTGDKTTRAEPLASWAEVHGIRVVRGAWVPEFIDELCQYPHGAHDDQVDSAAGAFNQLGGRVLPQLPVVRW